MKKTNKGIIGAVILGILATIQSCSSLVGEEAVISNVKPTLSEVRETKELDFAGIWETTLKEKDDLKISFDNTKQEIAVTSKKRGYRNYPINDWKYDGEKLSILIPHKLYYEVFVLEKHSDELKGYYLWDKEKNKVSLKKISDKPSEVDASTKEWSNSLEENSNYLKLNSNYQKDNTEYAFTYDIGKKEQYQDIIDKFNLDKITDGKHDIDLMKSILDFVCDNFKHSSYGSRGTVNSLEAAMERRSENISLNCRELSNLLAELLRVYGVEAKAITCIPNADIFGDCHVVVNAYSELNKQWVMLDPTYRLILQDKKGRYMDVQSYRKWVSDNGSSLEKMSPNDENYLLYNNDAGHTGSSSKFNLVAYTEYMAKNLASLRSFEVNGIGSQWGSAKGKSIYLVSKGFIRTGNYEMLSENQNMIITSDEERFFAKP